MCSSDLDVRPHPRLGTVEIRAMDSQTRLEHTIALSAMVISLVKLLTEEFQRAPAPLDPPWELLDENRWLAARHGLEAELVDDASAHRTGVRELTTTLLERLQWTGCPATMLALKLTAASARVNTK